MSRLIINGGKNLKGEVAISGSKNSALPLIAATLLAPGDYELTNVPHITDVEIFLKIIADLGGKYYFRHNQLKISTKYIRKWHLNQHLVQKLRASILLVAPLLARFGRAEIAHPGGCYIGKRPLDTHLKLFENFGVKIKKSAGRYLFSARKPKPAKIFLNEVSVTATENALLLAAALPGRSVIKSAACEPHVVDLANFLNTMGARISGAGTHTIMIEGAKKLLPTKTFNVSPDYIEAGTYLALGAAAKSRIKVSRINPNYLDAVIHRLREIGIKLIANKDSIEVFPTAKIKSSRIQIDTYPGFPTDLQAPFTVLATQADGTSLVHDWLFERRFSYIEDLAKMGANITLCDPHRILVNGPTELYATKIASPDLRAGMALVIAALIAEGESVIENAELIDRGYENVVEKLKGLGADIRQISN